MWWNREQPSPSSRSGGIALRVVPSVVLPLALLAAFTSDPRAAFPPARGEAVSPFGRRYLRDVELIAEVTVRAVYHLGLGVDVVKVHPQRVILDLRPRGARAAEPLLLAHRDAYLAGAKVLLLLKRFQGGDRMVVLHRISPRERDYTEKVRLLEAYVRIESMADRKKRLRSMVETVLANLEDPSPWVRSNSLLQLQGLVRDGAWRFTSGDVARIRALAGKETPGSIRKGMEAVAASMAAHAVKGPPSVSPPRTGEGTGGRAGGAEGGRDERGR